MSDKIALFRRRYIPNELDYLKDDQILAYSDEVIATKWKALRPRDDFSRGESQYYRKKGIKVTKIFDASGKFCYWYCDIVAEAGKEALDVGRGCSLKHGAAEFLLDGRENEDKVIVFRDILIDVVVYPDGRICVLDLDEFAEARKQGLISEEDAEKALKTTNAFLKLLYARQGKIDPCDDRFVLPY